MINREYSKRGLGELLGGRHNEADIGKTGIIVAPRKSNFFINVGSEIEIKTSKKVQLSTKAGKEYFEGKGIRYYVLTEKELFSGNKIKSSFNIRDYDK